MFDLAKRNLILFFRDKAAVCMSFLAEGIIVLLYFLFMREQLITQFAALEGAEILMDVWMLSGILGITSVTTTMGAFGIMVQDRASGVWKDFMITPVRRFRIIGGYMLAAFFVGCMMSILILLLACLYMKQTHQVHLLWENSGEILGYILLETFSNSALVIFLVSFLKSSNALASCCTIIGALLGFLTGIYLPIGSLPQQVQKLVTACPVSHGVVLIRRSLMEHFLFEAFAGQGQQKVAFEKFMGVRFWHEGNAISIIPSVIILSASGLFFYLLTVAKVEQMCDV